MGRSLASGRFELLHLLGEGGMGVVHAARDVERGETVAVKRLRRLGAESLLRFKHEFRALQDLRHPNLVTLRELLEDADTWLYTMDLVDGVDLMSWVRVDGRCDHARLRAALLQLADGLEALHAAGKVHRDIKPSNVLVTADGHVVLVDFGLVTEARADMSDVQIVGTAAYMAPEQATARPVDGASDWYAVGCLVYEALTGELPFDGTAVEVLMKKLDGQAIPPSAMPGFADIPADLDRLCVELLRIDPDARPDGDGVRRILGGRPRAAIPALARATPPTAASVFVGRQRELDQLDAAFVEAARRPVSVLIHGESGVGKSALARQFTGLLQAREPDVIVLSGRCFERESVRYKAIDGVVDALSRQLAKLPPDEVAAMAPPHVHLLVQVFPVLRRVEAIARAPLSDAVPDPGERRWRLFGALRELIAGLAARARVVIVVDDLQWADADGLAALGVLARPPASPILLVCTGRDPGDARGRLPGMRELKLGPLAADASRELADALARIAGTEIDADAIAREAGGHPLFVDELIRHAAEHGGGLHGDRLDDALRARIRRLAPDARRALELLAVARAPVPQGTLARAAELELPACLHQLDILRLGRLVRTSGTRKHDTAETFHDRVALAARGSLDDATRRDHHARLAVAYGAEPGVDPELLADHWAAAGEPARAALFAREAADAAVRALAFERAARLYLKVLELGAGDVDDGALYASLGDALVGAGRGAEAAGAYLAASSLAGPDQASALELRAADQLLRSGRTDDGVRTIQRVLAALGLGYPTTQRRALASLLWMRARLRLRGMSFRERDERQIPAATLMRADACWSASVGLGVVDFVRGAGFQTRHMVLALDAGEPTRIAKAMAAEAGFVAAGGVATQPRVEHLLARAGQLADKHRDVYAAAFTMATAGVAAFLWGKFRLARERCEQAERELRERCIGAQWELGTTQMFGLWASVQLGELHRLGPRYEQLVADARARGDRFGATHLVVGHAHMLALAADDTDRARREGDDAVREWATAGFQIPHCFHAWSQTQTDLYVQGAVGDAAWRRIEAVWPRVRAAMLLRVELIRIVMTYVRGRAALAASGGPRREEMLAEARRAASQLGREQAAWARPQADALRAGIAGAMSDPTERARCLAAAVAGFEAADMVLHAAAARRQLGVDGADGVLQAHGVHDPARMASMLCP